MARVTASEFADKWARRTTGATEDYKRGISRVSEAPGAKAARRQDAYVEGVRRAAESGKWSERVAAVPLGDWQRKAINKGAPRIAAGVQEAEGDVQKFAGELLDHIDSGRSQLESHPRGDLETNLQRMNTFVRHMSGFRRSAR